MKGRLRFLVLAAVVLTGMAVWFFHDAPVKENQAERGRTRSSQAPDAVIEYIVSGQSSKPSGDGADSMEAGQSDRNAEQKFPHYDTLEEARFRLGRLNEEIRDTVDGPTRLQIEEARHLRRELRRLKLTQVPEGETVDLRSLREEWLQEAHPAVPDALKKERFF